MKQKFLLALSILSILALSACGGADATPELSPEDTAATAMAEAWVAITQTAAALPTNTPVPPTFTPQPTNTALPTLAVLPTIPAATQPLAQLASPTPDCVVEPYPEPKGALVNVEFYNESGSSTNMSFGMNFPNDKNECFAYSFTFGINAIVPTKVLAGCYYGWAWVGGTDGSIAKTGDKLLCMTDANLIYKVLITEERVDFK